MEAFNESEDDIDRGSEIDQPNSMATLIMGFSKLKKPKAPALPSRSNDSSLMSDDEFN